MYICNISKPTIPRIMWGLGVSTNVENDEICRIFCACTLKLVLVF